MDMQDTIRRCKLGEKEAFQELLQTVEKKALATAYFLSRKRGITEDILQETYMKCFMEIDKLKDPEAFKVWFFRILVRTGWKMSKKQSMLVPTDITSENEALFYNEKQNEENIIDTYETKHIVKSAINNLSENLKTVVILYYFNDMSIEEISKVTGCFKATVKSRLFYARGALKKQLGDCFENQNHLVEVKCKQI
ncbi:RNA polymerase sigma factor [Clostridium botulinum]|uniref:Sigma-70 family RNA polymerase sigma factor n=1 Tax=Clostridium botulinum TaxID=1491 RepID=A0A6B4JHM0_CLOBO|nr:sigma-70 family RNA polymerase sigma factor [Clostridium botulinum]EES47945.1 RNA polymerase sigma-70 factor [Clostridium botulinum E1 str. 'BoNT E Beluga']MBY6759792.1 sigma-70 family RNA polymerase sigma factor [Clostridium botulinum]MBY6918701.1 sigma-70 family RNA polymerase sigma factor [Clostridium botulinum]NFJ56506.1 sigma-70 family RNA polymerase sigma factor [Clostridium botulinum]NFL51034.1 sigma-70 family RNA polymerase sigma factor [Clostridium botulinum]